MRLLVGVTGGIACYKACELVSLAVGRGHSVRVVMTDSATRFIGTLTFEGLTGHPVLVGMDHLADGQAMSHIEWAKWTEVACIAPLTANTLAKLAVGIADDALTTVLMAIPAARPVILGPAMNTEMWNQPVVQRNLQWIADLNRFEMVQPVEKRLACGDYGVGGLATPEALLAACEAAHN